MDSNEVTEPLASGGSLPPDDASVSSRSVAPAEQFDHVVPVHSDGKYDEALNRFTLNEKRALGFYSLPGDATNEQRLRQIREEGLPAWQANIKLIEGLDRLKLPAIFRARDSLLTKYCELRIKSYQLIYSALYEGTDKFADQLRSSNLQTDSVINDLKIGPQRADK